MQMIPQKLSFKDSSLLESYLQPSNKILVSLFDGGIGTEWIKIGGNGTLVDDTDNFIFGSKSIKAIVSNTGMMIDKTISLDLTNFDCIKFTFYIDDITKLNYLSPYFSNGNWSSYFTYDFLSAGLVQGWNTVEHHKSDFAATGGPSWAAIDKIRFKAYANSGQTVSINFNEWTVKKQTLPRAAVIFTFDDCELSTYTEARRIMDKYGYSGVAFVPTSWVGNANKMTTTQLQNLQNFNGWDIASHTHMHPDLTTLTSNQIENEFIASLKWFQNNGIRRTPILAYPGGKYNPTVLDVTKKYFSYARETYGISRYLSFPFSSRYTLRSFYVLNTNNLATVEGLIDTVITRKAILILCFHRLVASPSITTEWPITDFQSLIDYLSGKNLDVVSFSQLLRLTRGLY